MVALNPLQAVNYVQAITALSTLIDSQEGAIRRDTPITTGQTASRWIVTGVVNDIAITDEIEYWGENVTIRFEAGNAQFVLSILGAFIGRGLFRARNQINSDTLEGLRRQTERSRRDLEAFRRLLELAEDPDSFRFTATQINTARRGLEEQVTISRQTLDVTGQLSAIFQREAEGLGLGGGGAAFSGSTIFTISRAVDTNNKIRVGRRNQGSNTNRDIVLNFGIQFYNDSRVIEFIKDEPYGMTRRAAPGWLTNALATTRSSLEDIRRGVPGN